MNKLDARHEVMRLAQVGFMKEWFGVDKEIKHSPEVELKIANALECILDLFGEAELLES